MWALRRLTVALVVFVAFHYRPNGSRSLAGVLAPRLLELAQDAR